MQYRSTTTSQVAAINSGTGSATPASSDANRVLASHSQQTVRAQLSGQLCQVNVYRKPAGPFMDLLLDNSPMVMGVICENRNRIVRDAYLGFISDMVWLDTQGIDNPVYTGIGTRFFLAYLFPENIT